MTGKRKPYVHSSKSKPLYVVDPTVGITTTQDGVTRILSVLESLRLLALVFKEIFFSMKKRSPL
jgi:hypothetical protein